MLIIFGATGDLAHRRLVPALYELSSDGLLPAPFSLIGVARREFTSESFREELRETVAQRTRRPPLDSAVWGELERHTFYLRSSFDDHAGFGELRKLLDEIDAAAQRPCRRVFYLSTSPEYFATICTRLKEARLLDDAHRARVVIEKPFGTDLESARALNQTLRGLLAEEQLYRVDHYLGKETVQNLLIFRFANGIFEPIWNRRYVHHVEISVAESIGVENRAGYFDRAGLLRDIVQNHALQLLSLIALEPPAAFHADAVRDEKLKVLRSVRPLTHNDVREKTVRGRYTRGYIAGSEVAGYLEEPGIAAHSLTETYVALELRLDNWRWAGTPFFIRAGKRLPKQIIEISIHFQRVPHGLFAAEGVGDIPPDILAFQIQPDEGISMRISAKPPGLKMQVQQVSMNFSYGSSFGLEPPQAYERLLLDTLRGDPTLFTRSDEIEAAWEIVRPIQEVWAARRTTPVFDYEAGTWGPVEAEQLIRRSIGQPWRQL